tara:strand:+ start:7559 stop:7789 length:231 start_codon:yes stop_codon:yes gene_type:complete
MDNSENKQLNLDEIRDEAKTTVTAKDLKIIMSLLRIGCSRGMFKPDDLSLLGELNNNVKKALFDISPKQEVFITKN